MLSDSALEARDGRPSLWRPPVRQDEVHRMPLGIDIVITDAAPAQLPQERRPLKETSPPVGGSRPAPRPQRLIARDSGEYLFVGLRGGRADTTVSPGPAEILLRPGDICFYDPHQPSMLDFPERFHLKVFLLPRELLGLAESELHRITTAPVTHTSRLGTLLSPLLSDLARAAAVSRPPAVDMLARNTVNLLATLAAEHSGEAVQTMPDVQSPLVPRILEFIELHLTDPDLSPEVIARSHHISVRYLHKVFEDVGTTVGRWIQRRRLEECRRELLRARGSRTIASVAHRWGFISATHFSRVFRAAYGMSPREWRDTVSRGNRSAAVRGENSGRALAGKFRPALGSSVTEHAAPSP